MDPMTTTASCAASDLAREVPALDPLLQYLEGLHEGRADLRRLTELFQRLGDLRWENLERFAVFSDTGYQRIRLCANDHYELVLLCWKSGQQSPIHDHARSVCGVRVLKGACDETRFRISSCGRLQVDGTRQWKEGEVCASADRDIHLFANYQAPGQILSTLHVYSPPLLSMHQYRFDDPTARPFDEETLYEPGTVAAPKAQETIYLNNAATSWPKPERVHEAVNRALRGAWSLNRTAGRKAAEENFLEPARARVAAFLGISDPQRLAFVPGCTYASNIAVQALPWKAGDQIVMSGLEHNASARPCRLVGERHRVEVFTAPYRPGDPISLEYVEARLREGHVRLVASTMASNVTGEIFPYRELREMTRKYGALLFLDAAQAGGVLPVNIAELQPDLIVFAGDKGLHGPPGIGLLYVDPHVEQRFFAVGGTGHDSGKLDMSARMPAMFEVGTFNGPAIAGLDAGVQWVKETGTEAVLRRERELASRFLAGLASIAGAHVYGGADPTRRVAVVSCRFEGRDPRTVAGWLAERGIITRAGFHCAPLAHQTIGSHPFGGPVRFSFGYHLTPGEVDQTLAVLAEMPADLGRSGPPAPPPPPEQEIEA